MNNLGMQILKSFEGCKLRAYKDPVGIWTIGYGHTGQDVHDGLEWTQEQADMRLDFDVMKHQTDVEKLLRVSLNDDQISALTDFCYNLGARNLRTSTLLKRINAGDFDVKNEFVKWVKAGGKTLAGLVTRREAEAALFSGDHEVVVRILKQR